MYFLKNIPHYFINIFCGLYHHIGKLLHYSFWVQEKEGFEVELFRGMME